MMEESSDESAEMIDKEEAVKAEQQYVAQTQSAQSTITMSPLAPPAPLPSFMTLSSSTDVSTTPQVAQMSVTPQKSTVITPVSTPVGAPVSTPVGTGNTTPVLQPLSQQQITPPGPQQSPYEASSSIEVPEGIEMAPSSPQGQHGGLFGWISGNKMLSKVVEKTKSSMESMITTLDPGMREVIKSGGDTCVIVTSTKESKVGAIREAFQNTFGRATVIGKESQATTAAQPVGYTSGLKGAQERIQNLRQSSTIPEDQPIVSVEGFIVEMLPDRWYELSCLVLQDPQHRIDLQTFSQPSPIPAEYILKSQDRTPSDYPLRWSGLAVTIGQIVGEELPHIGHVDWQSAVVGVSRRESLYLAAKSLAYMYKKRLPAEYV